MRKFLLFLLPDDKFNPQKRNMKFRRRNLTAALLAAFFLFTEMVIPQNFLIDTTFNLPGQVDTINTSSIDYKSVPGKFQLQTGENENLALRRSAYIVYEGVAPTDTALRNGNKLVDGSKSSPSFVSILAGSQGAEAGTYMMVDLQAVRNVKKVVLYTFAGSPNLRPRAFSIYAGLDTVTMERVFQQLDNQVVNPVSEFDAIVCQYVKIEIDVIPQNFNTTIAEIEVFGEGFLPQGYFYSSVRNVGQDVNFGTYEFKGNIPDGTSVSFNFRTGNSPTIDSTWSNFGDELIGSDLLFEVYEPRKYIQYRVKLTTTNLLSPSIDEVKINYDNRNVVSSTDAYISPQISQILKEAEFSLIIDASFNPSDYGIDTLYIFTPSPITLKDVTINGVAVGYLSKVTASKVTLFFNSTINSNSRIQIRFLSTPFLGVSPYSAKVSSKLVANNPQKVNSKVINNIEAWSVITDGVPEKLLISVKAAPNPFTPNNDGVNDETNIEFFLGNIAEPRGQIGDALRDLSIKIYDLTGRLIKDLYNSKTGAYAFISDNGVTWDGRDNDGKLVRPGLYLFQIIIDSDNGGENITKTIVVSY
ncbi:MAG: gliding motility-associated C-terminal domain-containing protein [Ignavibacteriaceae bacterium]|nr:gliding motility-associated C-terminal domain-containing protein [Ignavibacteriaceae bacterium]